jgi:hypothetical protein
MSLMCTHIHTNTHTHTKQHTYMLYTGTSFLSNSYSSACAPGLLDHITLMHTHKAHTRHTQDTHAHTHACAHTHNSHMRT